MQRTMRDGDIYGWFGMFSVPYLHRLNAGRDYNMLGNFSSLVVQCRVRVSAGRVVIRFSYGVRP